MSRLTVLFMLVLVLAVAVACAPARADSKPVLRSRADFARAIAKLKPGMTANEVTKALGAPDDIKTEADPGGISAARTVEVWRYGTRGHGTFGTLGTVHVQADRKVQYVFGGKGKPPAGFDEAELRRLLELVAAVPSYNDALEPLALIQAVNALVPLGKPRALAVIDEFLRVSSDLDDRGREGVFLLDRALFDVPASGVMPEMMVGASGFAPLVPDPKLLPRLPLVIVDDIPLKLIGGYMLGGVPEQPETDVDWFRKNGTLRKAPMAPPARPLEVIDAYLTGPLAKLAKVDSIMLYDQALRLVGTAYRPASTVDGWFPYTQNVTAEWAKVRAAVAAVNPKWDATASRYTRADGSIVAAPVAGWKRVWWDLKLPGAAKARATFERRATDRVDVELRVELPTAGKVSAGTLRILDATGGKLGEVAIPALTAPASSTSGSVSGTRLTVPVGTKLHLELVQGATTTKGPELTP